MFKLFKNKTFWKSALTLAVPVALQNMLTSSFTLADTLLVSRLGDIALSSVGMVGQWGWLMNMVIFGFCSGTTVFVSQFWGANDKKRIHSTLGTALVSVLVVSGIFTVISLAIPQYVLRMFNSDPEIIAEGSKYLSVVAYSYFAVAITNILSTVLRSTEEVRLPMYVSGFTTLLNIFLDYCMIFGKCGFAEMGIKGAALATSVSAWAGVAVIVIVSVIRKTIIICPFKEIFCFKKNEVREFYKKSVPVVFNEGMWGAGTFAFNLIYANMGYEYFASVTILRSFENIAFVFFIGLCSACSVMVGKSIGKGKIEEGVADSKRFAFLVPSLAVFVSVIIILLRHQLVGIFNMGSNISEVTLNSAVIIMTIYACELPIRMVPYIQVVGIFRSGGDTVTGVKYDLCCLWLISLPATLITVHLIKAPFVVAFAVMYIFEDYFKTFLCIRHYRSKKWLKPVTKEGRDALESYKANGMNMKAGDEE